MIYFYGDIHGNVQSLIDAMEHNHVDPNDTVVLLGDVGLNYYGNNHGQVSTFSASMETMSGGLPRCLITIQLNGVVAMFLSRMSSRISILRKTERSLIWMAQRP